MKKIIITICVLLILALSGCKSGVTSGAIVCNEPYILVGSDCCLDKNNNALCDKDETEEAPAETVEPPKEEIIEEPEDEPEEEIKEEAPVEELKEELLSNEFLIKVGDSVEFDKKTITLIDIDNMPELKSTFNIDGTEKEVFGTKNVGIVNGLFISVVKYFNLQNSVTVKLEKIELLPPKYLINPGKDITINGLIIHLEDVLDSGKIQIKVLGTNLENSKFIIKEGETKTFAGLEITNIEGFPVGFKRAEYAIIKLQ